MKVPSLHVKRTSAEAAEYAVKWATVIAGLNSFHYGSGKGAHHNGCYFCGTQDRLKKNSGIVDYQKSYCCNPFIGAAWAHGGLVPKALSMCQNNKSWDFHEGTGYDTSPLFTKLGHPKKSELKIGDVLCRGTHVALYAGNGKIVHAGHEDDNKKGSKSWNSSISVQTLTDKNYANFPRVYRFNGTVDADILIRFGEYSERVKDLQLFLRSRGYEIAPDGIFFDETLKAVKSFQTIHGLEADGIVGPATIKAIEAYVVSYPLPTAEQIKTASLDGIRRRMIIQAEKTAADKNIHYVRWKPGDSKTHECPYCKKHPVGPYYGGNCIWGGFHTWKHGAGLPINCSCHTISDGTGNDMLRAKTDAEALKIARKYIGVTDIQVIRNKSGIPTSSLLPGDVALLFNGDSFYHVILCQGGSKYADCTSGRADQYKAGMTMSSATKRNLKLVIRYTGGFNYVQKYDHGEAVRLMQAWLNAHGYECGAADGIFGDKTTEAVKKFQTAHGLTADGLAGSKTFDAMRG